MSKPKAAPAVKASTGSYVADPARNGNYRAVQIPAGMPGTVCPIFEKGGFAMPNRFEVLQRHAISNPLSGDTSIQPRVVWRDRNWSVGLASVSYHNNGRLVCTEQWTRDDSLFALGQLILQREVLAGRGDASKQRLFRMNITLCLHRAVLEEEAERLPRSWHCATWGMAGAPVEIFWAQGTETRPSCMPCEFPIKRAVSTSRPDSWIPDDCGVCDACMDRAALRRESQSRVVRV